MTNPATAEEIKMEVVPYHRLCGVNGKAIHEENMAIPHRIPIGTLVEVKYDTWHREGACEKVHARLWVVEHNRDCDGTPLYYVSQWRDPESAKLFSDIRGGFGEESLTPVEITEEVRRGDNALTWPDED